MVELDNLDVRILGHLKNNSRKSFKEVAKSCFTSVPTIKSRVDRMVELGIITRFTIDIDESKLGISEALLLVNAKPLAVSRLSRELCELDEIKELYITSDSDVAIVARLVGDIRDILAIQDRIELTDVSNIRIISVKNVIKKDTSVPLASSSIILSCAYCSKKVTDGVVRKKIDEKDYFFCCNTCRKEFEKKYTKLLDNA